MERDCEKCVYMRNEYDEKCMEKCAACSYTSHSNWKEKIEYKIVADVLIRISALKLVDAERNRQDEKWGQQNHAQQAWVGILGEEYGEYCQAVNETYLNNATKKNEGGYENLLKELTHVAAVAVGAMESLMRNRGNE